MNQKLFVANWKEGPLTEALAVELAQLCDQEGTVICPPKKYIKTVFPILKHASLGVQDGEGATRLVAEGIKCAIVGHSSRRANGETDEMVTSQIIALREQGIVPIVCVGEKREDRDLDKAQEVVGKQLEAVLVALTGSETSTPVYIAYEPIWAISINQDGVAQPADADKVSKMLYYIQHRVGALKTPIHYLYGGSVDASTAAQFLLIPQVEGLLVGAASIDPDRCRALIRVLSRT